MNLNASWSWIDNLKAAQSEKSKVEIHLRGGGTLAGTVAAVGDHAVHLTQLAGKEFFDALVRLDDISALEVRVRK